LATSRCRPGSSGSGEAKSAFRVVVPPAAVTYSSSHPPRSAEVGPAFDISTYSSDADVPPVTTSASSNWDDEGQEVGVTA
jgi:hypothetical protein